MKIAVYTICKNEAQFVNRWITSCKDADVILVTDTGSTDTTIPDLLNLKSIYPQIEVNSIKISPWRFDDARNYSLLSLPQWVDVCICLDMDEILLEGWREKVEKAYQDNTLDRLRYNYIWSWNEDGSAGITYYADKIHRRFGYRWVNPVHETLAKDTRLSAEVQAFIPDTLIEHHPDNTKSRGYYLDLLALSTRENPLNDRNAHYYARDLMFAGKYEQAVREFTRHLNLPTALWKPERSASYRYMGDCYWALGKVSFAIASFKLAIAEAPLEREPYIALAQAYRVTKNWEGVVENCMKALAIVEKPNTYICQPSAWSDWPDQMLNEARTNLGECYA